MRNQIVALEYKAYRVVAVAVPIGIGEGFRRSSRNVEIAVRVAVKPADDVEERCFSAAGRTEDRNKFALSEIDRYAPQCFNGAVACDVCFLYFSERKHVTSFLLFEMDLSYHSIVNCILTAGPEFVKTPSALSRRKYEKRRRRACGAEARRKSAKIRNAPA